MGEVAVWGRMEIGGVHYLVTTPMVGGVATAPGPDQPPFLVPLPQQPQVASPSRSSSIPE